MSIGSFWAPECFGMRRNVWEIRENIPEVYMVDVSVSSRLVFYLQAYSLAKASRGPGTTLVSLIVAQAIISAQGIK